VHPIDSLGETESHKPRKKERAGAENTRAEEDRVGRGHEVTTRRRRDGCRVEEERESPSGARNKRYDRLAAPSENVPRVRHEYSRVRGGRPKSARYLQVTLRQAAVFRRTQIKGNVFVDKY